MDCNFEAKHSSDINSLFSSFPPRIARPHEPIASVTMADQEKNLSLTASYKSPTSESFAISHAIPAPPSSSVADKTTYLSSLRQALASTQEQVNKELTERMEQDKAREGNDKVVDDAKEEENYGEEVVEEDD